MIVINSYRFAAAGGGGFAPTDIAGLRLWFEADKLTGFADADSVSSWSDFSGNNNHAIQGTSGNRPTYRTGQINGKPVVRSDADDYLTLTTQISLTNYTAYAVMKLTGGSDRRVLASGTDQYVFDLYAGDSKIYTGAGAYGSSTGVFGNDVYLLAEVTKSGGTVNFWKNAASCDADTSMGSGAQTITYLIHPSFPCPADIAAVLLFDTVLNSTNQGLVRTYLNSKYAIY